MECHDLYREYNSLLRKCKSRNSCQTDDTEKIMKQIYIVCTPKRYDSHEVEQ